MIVFSSKHTGIQTSCMSNLIISTRMRAVGWWRYWN